MHLLEALKQQHAAMEATKTYVTGGVGSRWEGESFGDPYELPPDRAYAETCAAIGGIQWAWRMLLATGDPTYADAIERKLCNGFLAGVSHDGREFFYVNPLQVRSDAHPDDSRSPANGRRPWFLHRMLPSEHHTDVGQLAGLPGDDRRSGLAAPAVCAERPSGRRLGWSGRGVGGDRLPVGRLVRVQG